MNHTPRTPGYDHALKFLMNREISFEGTKTGLTALHTLLTDCLRKMNFANYTWSERESPLPMNSIRTYRVTNLSTTAN